MNLRIILRQLTGAHVFADSPGNFVPRSARMCGLFDVCDAGVIESALAQPHNQQAYGNVTDIATLAVAYGFGLTRTHGHVDGAKHIGFVAMAVFLDINRLRLEAPQLEVVRVMLAVASGEMDEASLAAWVRGHIQTSDAAIE